MLTRFVKDLKKYFRYAVRSAKSSLKAEVSGSYLNWLWWIMNPVCFMLIYNFVFGTVFNAKEKYFTAFIFVGITMWDFFSHCITHSVRMIKNNRAIVQKVYLPKFVLLVADMLSNGFKMLISFAVTAVLMIIYGIRPTLSMLYIIPIIITLYTVTFACSTFVLHLGVFIQDLPNAIKLILKLLFYLTGIFYDIQKRIPEPLNYWAVRVNPIACLIDCGRGALLYNEIRHPLALFLWFSISVLVAFLGVCVIYKNENTYVKVS